MLACGIMPTDINLIGLKVAQVQVIFALPEEYGTFRHPLTYVEWFTPFHTPAQDLGMYQVSQSTHSGYRWASIIVVNQIERLVHLVPKFGRQVDRTWTVDDILELCKTFYVNPYL